MDSVMLSNGNIVTKDILVGILTRLLGVPIEDIEHQNREWENFKFCIEYESKKFVPRCSMWNKT